MIDPKNLRRVSKLECGPVELKLFVNLKKTQGYLACRLQNGAFLAMSEVVSFIANEGITEYKIELIEKFVEKVNSKETTDELALIANGIEPESGKDGHVVLVEKPYPREHVFETKDENAGKFDHQIDYKNLEKISNVLPGQVLAIIQPQVEGSFGMDIYGNPVHPSRCNPPKYNLGANVIVDDNKILSTKDGLFLLIGETYSVSPIYVVNGNVDYHTGHINFVGTVKVTGDVLTDFHVQAESDIMVFGNVDSTQIQSNSSVVVLGGVNGDKKALIKAGDNFNAKYVNGARVETGKNIYVSDYVSNSDIKCNGAYIGVKSAIISGKVVTKNGVKVGSIGSSKSSGVEVITGVDYTIEDELVSLKNKISEINSSIKKLTPNVAPWIGKREELKKQPESKIAKIVSMLNEIQHMHKEINSLNERTSELILLRNKVIENDCEIFVKDMIYSGSKIVMGDSFREFFQDCEGPVYMKVNRELDLIIMRRVQ